MLKLFLRFLFMNFKENIGLILSIIGILLSLTIIGMLIGIPLLIIGIYLLNKKSSSKEWDYKIQQKQKELDNIDEKLERLEKDKNDEINEKLKEKREKLNNINKEYEEKSKLKEKELKKNIKYLQKELDNIDRKYNELKKTKEKTLENSLKDITKKLEDKNKQLDDLTSEVKEKNKELSKLKNEIETELYLQEHGLYEPKYNFTDSIQYKEKLDQTRKRQKEMIKNKKAAIATREWLVDGDKRKGQKMTNLNIKQILRAFNNESEVIINKVKHSNIESSEKRLKRSYESLNKIFESDAVKITEEYYKSKVNEMHLAYEYALKKQEEKEILREEREREREEKKLQKKLEKEKNKFQRENTKLENEISKANEELLKASVEEKARLKKEIQELKEALQRNNGEIEKINEWKETPGAGYVYIISNIGSFGEEVFKIGVTRRDNPDERIRELSSASVPFRYDNHVFIFSNDAYGLEKELHDRFDDRRVNKVNRRKEFFKITMNEVKQIVEENKADVHSFIEKPDAEEYYDTLKIEEKLKKK